MKNEIRHRKRKTTTTAKWSSWWLTLLAAVWLLLPSACSNSESEPVATEEKKPTMLSIYVYAPDRPIMTRADIGNVAAETEQESVINNLQIWVFTHGANKFVGYLNPSPDKLNSDKQDIYMMQVDDDFVANRPAVDVYVLANVTDDNCGISFDGANEASDFSSARIGHQNNNDYFGLTNLTTTIPSDGLPMSGVLYNQAITGESPVFRIGSGDQIATVKLTRIVSKLRFLFSQNASSTEDVRINAITIKEDIVPTEEYLFLEESEEIDDGRRTHVGNDYEPQTELTNSIGIEGAIAKCEDPMVYLYKDGQEAQDYEDKLQEGLAKTTPELTMTGPFYLRESDKKLSGTIHYTVDGQERTATFPIESDSDPEGNFQRNHTLVVYSYFSGGDRLEVNSVFVKWNEWNRIQSVYNW